MSDTVSAPRSSFHSLPAAGGVMLDFNELDNTRVFINPSVGVKIGCRKQDLAITFSTGLMVQRAVLHARKSFINFKLGLELKGKK